ncbi:helix-turn-helix domain-containing protein [Flavobacterium phycosphaerae]|uniref:helix-turn-helix domain-containing protein n=1 Tax=Flavobacterium phycosphaerae TaxID=2697515 RepID=UPI00138AFDC3|nr:helix-turn-helix domain-containing protein [Flavobacterium phycosphaerae]
MSSKEFKLLQRAIEELKNMLLTNQEVAVSEVFIDSHQMERFLKCSPSTLQRLRNNGTVPCFKMGRKYYYPKNLFTQEALNSIRRKDDPSKRFDDKD